MSALDVTNSMMDSEQQVAITTAGNRDIEKDALRSKESNDGLRDDLHTGTGSVSTGKATVSLLSKGYAGTKAAGVGDFIGGEAEKTGKFLSSVPGAKRAGAAVARGADAVGSYATGGKSIIGAVNTGGEAHAAGFATADHAMPGAAASGAADPADVSKALSEGKAALTAATPEAAAGGATEELAGKLLAAGGKFSGAMKGLGALGGVVDLGEDIVGGKIAGDNSSEKLGNKLTIAGTVLDFIPGMEVVGMGLNAIGAYESLKGSDSASAAQNTANKNKMAALNKPSPAVHSWSQMGLVSSMAPDALHTMAGSTHF